MDVEQYIAAHGPATLQRLEVDCWKRDVLDWAGALIGCSFPYPVDQVHVIARSHGGAVRAAAIYHCFKRMSRGSEIELSFVTEEPRMLAAMRREIFRWPFDELGVSVLRAQHEAGNLQVARLLEGMGFKYEGIKRRGWNGTDDSAWYSMTPEECPHLGPVAKGPVN